MPSVFKDALFQSQWLRAASHSSSGGAEIGECLAAASQIHELDGESWYRAWNQLAETVLAQAEESRAANRLVSARAAYLRASNYFRAAYTFLIGEPVDPRVVAAYRQHRAAFAAAIALMRPSGLAITIPYENTTLHGYLFRSAEDDIPRPTLIIVGGYDSTAEEAYFFSGQAAVERGYTCITFDGPGQGAALIEHGLRFRPDWEAVVGPVVDYALTRPEVGRAKIALMGISFGGYLAPRAASGEARLAACIVDPGLYSLYEEFESRLPKFLARQLGNENSLAFRLIITLMNRRMRRLTAGWALRRGLWTHGVDSVHAYFQQTRQYSLHGRAERIRCPMLLCSAENDDLGATERKLFDVLKCQKAFVSFPASQGAGEHCEIGARSLFNQRAFDWLDTVLGR
jgi:pimeloyl-ACP methyl ester carboxylesterase